MTDVRCDSHYIEMPDGVALAIDIWRPDCGATPCPVILGFTRYWRGYDIGTRSVTQQRLYGAAAYFAARGIAFVMCDARGSGASFGTRSCEYAADEVRDYAHVAAWVRRQPWCDGDVVSFGVSYSGNAALLAAAHGGPVLKAAVPCFIDYDLFHHSACPGGIPNRWMAENWGGLTAALDRNDFRAAMRFQPHPPAEEVLAAVQGVKPVDDDEDRIVLGAAIAMHGANFRSDGQIIAYADQVIGRARETTDDISVSAHLASINAAGVPIHARAGWFDGGTAMGALALFNALTVPCRIAIGPWNHGMTYKTDPFGSQRVEDQAKIPGTDTLDAAIDVLRAPAGLMGKVLRYFTYGADEWRETGCWPVRGVAPVALYCAQGGTLSATAPTITDAHDRHRFDRAASTGSLNRWHTQIGSTPVVYPRQTAALLTYDTPQLAADCELTGEPQIVAFIRADAADAALFFYLEAVAPDGNVAMLAEGWLRAQHRDGVLGAADARRLGRRYSFRRDAIQPLEPGAIARLACDLTPISARVPAGHKLRFSIAGADAGTFVTLPGVADAIDLMRDTAHPSHLILPVVGSITFT